MLVQHFWLKNEDGGASFLCGAVSVVCEYFNADLLEKDVDLYITADVFHIGSSNDIPFDTAIRSRFVSYMHNIYVDDPHGYADSINSLSLKLKKNKQSLDKILLSIFAKNSLSDVVTDKQISDFCASLFCFFSKPIAIYNSDDLLKDNKLMKEYYAHNVRDILFVEFTSYLLILVIGSDT